MSGLPPGEARSREPEGGATRWRVSWSYAVLALVSFVLAGVSILVDWMGGPMVFAFCTVFSVFVVFGAIQWKTEAMAGESGRTGRDESG